MNSEMVLMFMALGRLALCHLSGTDRDQIEILYELISAREALICTNDTNTLRLLCQASAMHIISPGALLKDFKKLAFDIPGKWYITLMEFKLKAERARTDLTILTEIQTVAATHNDWRFKYGMISVLLDIVVHSPDAKIRKQAIQGSELLPAILTLNALFAADQARMSGRQGVWISRQAKWTWSQVEERLNIADRQLVVQPEPADKAMPQAAAKARALRASKMGLFKNPLSQTAVAETAQTTEIKNLLIYGSRIHCVEQKIVRRNGDLELVANL